MVDTNIFNAISKGKLDLACLPRRPLFATAIQQSELEVTPCHELRAELISTFHLIDAKRLATSAAVWGVSHWGQAGYGSTEQNEFVKEFADAILIRDRKAGKRSREPRMNAVRDALIALTAREFSLVLLTRDRCLSEVAHQFAVACELIV